MTAGIRVELQVDAPASCPIARVSGETGASSHSISRSTTPDGGRVTEEFLLDADAGEAATAAEMDEVFSYGEQGVYRFSRDPGVGCPCECIEQFGCPVVDVHADDGTLGLAFHASDMEQLQTVIESFREAFPNVDIQRLLRSSGDPDDRNLVFVDRGRLTARQHEVLETAHEMGYFDHPKGANAGEVADALDINTSTFTEHLAAAQRKILDAVLDGGRSA
ncbi:MAG: helix-turn-helix domain-containing protein [Haloarculaceae archaeon]